MATYVLTIGGTTKTVQPGWSITAPANGVGTMTFDIYSSNGSYIPAINAEVILTEDGTRIFGGVIKSVSVEGAGGQPITPIISRCTAEDFNALAERRYYSGTVSGTLVSILTTLVAYIPGATLSGSQVTGPTLHSITYSMWKINDILDQLSTLTGYVWRIDYNKVLSMYTPGSISAPFNVTLASGAAYGDLVTDETRQDYYNSVYVHGNGVIGTASDATAIAANGYFEIAYQSDDADTQTAVDALAAAILSASLVSLKTVKYQTRNTGILPGMTQTITLSSRNVNNTYLVTDVEVACLTETSAMRYVTATEGLVKHDGWRETVKTWGGTGSVQQISGGLSSSTSFVRNAYFLGGTGEDFVQSGTPTWVDASPIQVQINTVARGSTSATVTARLRALSSGVSVQARLYDATASAACTGTSSVVTSTSWTLVTFTVTLTAGSHYYKLQLLPGTANEDVGAVAYIE